MFSKFVNTLSLSDRAFEWWHFFYFSALSVFSKLNMHYLKYLLKIRFLNYNFILSKCSFPFRYTLPSLLPHPYQKLQINIEREFMYLYLILKSLADYQQHKYLVPKLKFQVQFFLNLMLTRTMKWYISTKELTVSYNMIIKNEDAVSLLQDQGNFDIT